ncbi:family 43 glycosylhydrolase [Candidatus Gracilibacteria bacterium]|nr:family 43 glycosylhydrolase [Candidatus Gracilibacteria bacterium]
MHYQNPVYAGSFPDPYVLKHCGEYWAYCTGDWPDGRRFGILRSRDLVQWQPVGGALEPLPTGYPFYWAPEVVYDNGRFYMYYSAGDELNAMALRVAIAEHPGGPFVDSGRTLTAEPFAIDAHVFVDDDGARYLFYATDYLEHTHVGTGTAMARLRDHLALAEVPRPVTRARFDWQVYDPQRAQKGGVRWHTLEGPFVLKRKGRYYQMFSGGNWQNLSYGVSYATSDQIDRAAEWEQHADGQRILPIVRTIPGRVIGPGHNSVVRGPDNMQLFCVYHRWSPTADARQMAIDPLDWAGERLLVLGPSDTPQSLSATATAVDFFDHEHDYGLGAQWECKGGSWHVQAGSAVQAQRSERAMALFAPHFPCAIAELSLRADGTAADGDGLGVVLTFDSTIVLRCVLLPARGLLQIAWLGPGDWREHHVALPLDFVPQVYHLLRIATDGQQVRIALDEGRLRWQGLLDLPAEQIGLLSEGAPAMFAGFALTVGWEDDFFAPLGDLVALGWRANSRSWALEQGLLRFLPAAELDTNPEPSAAHIVKGPLLADYTLVVNARLDSADALLGYGFLPASDESGQGPTLWLEAQGTGWALRCVTATGTQLLALPAECTPLEWQQFRFRKHQGQLDIAWEQHDLGTIAVPMSPSRVGLCARAAASFDLVRVCQLA